MNRKISFIPLLLLASSASYAVPITIDVRGTISGFSAGNPSALNQNTFQVGDSVAYQVTLDDGLMLPGAGVTRNTFLVSDYRARVSDYRIQGSSGDAFLRNDTQTGVFGEPYDQLSLGHFAEPVYNQGFNMPGRTDFEFTDGNVAGYPLIRLSLLTQHPDVEFVGAGENLTQVAQNIEANLDALKQPAISRPSTPTVQLDVDFSDMAFGSLPFGVKIDVDSFQVNPSLTVDPLASGTAAAAIVKDQRFDSVADTYDSSNTDAFAFAFNTQAGQAAARAEITDELIQGTNLTAPGLEVGVFASGAGEAGNTISRAVSFRSFEYTENDPINLNINSMLEGEFDDAPFGLPSGQRSLEGGIYVFDAFAFADAVDWLGGDFEEIFFPLDNKNTDLLNPTELDDSTAPSLLGLNPLASLEFSQAVTFEQVMRELNLALGFANATSFTVLYDLSAFANVSCFGDRCGAGSVNFLNSLTSAQNFFTDSQGNPVTSIRAIDASSTQPSPVPEPSVLVLFLSTFGILGFVQRRRSYCGRSVTTPPD